MQARVQILADNIAAYAFQDLGLPPVEICLSTAPSDWEIGVFHVYTGKPVIIVWVYAHASLTQFVETILHEIRHYWQRIRQTYQDMSKDHLSEQDADQYAHDTLQCCEFVRLLN